MSGESPPPLPPDDPPPLPPPDDDFQTASNLQQMHWATAQSGGWSDDAYQGYHSWSVQNSSSVAQGMEGLTKASAQAGQASSADVPIQCEDLQPPPPPAPPSPSAPSPWQDPQSLGLPPGEQADPAALKPHDDTAPWLYQSTQGNQQDMGGTGQQWQTQWYQGYDNYSQGYGQYEGYAAYPEQQFQQASDAAGYTYEGKAGFSSQPSYPWSQPQGVSSQTAVPTKNEVDASDIFMPPGRFQRPAKIAIIMRGLPGSGKTHIAKRLREIEVEQGGEAPRIHALDDYFVTEVEKEIIDEQPGKRPKKRVETVMEYLYEQELEDSYRASILKAFTKTVDEGRFPFVILDAPNIQVEDFRPFYMAAQRVGYVVYVLNPLQTSPEVCFSRNVHQRDLDTISDLAAIYEPTPTLFTQILVDSLFDLHKQEEAGNNDSREAIEEVDMEEDAKDGGEEPDEPQIKSRWASLEDEAPGEEAEAPKKKKRRKTGENQEELAKAGEAAVHSENGKVARRSIAASILKQAGGKPSQKVLRWADEVTPAEGFSIGGAGAQQLEEVHFLEGLGPSPEAHHSNLSHQSFVELARKERTTEKHSFKDLLLGRRPL